MKKILILLLFSTSVSAQKIDTIVYNIKYRDTVIYIYDTVKVTNSHVRMSSWGLGPIGGFYYSPYTGVDLKVGIGLQYNLFHNFLRTTPRKKRN